MKTSLPAGPVAAELRIEGGQPTLYINGERIAPTMFAAISDPGYDPAKTEFQPYGTVLHEMELATKAGTRIVRTIITIPIAYPDRIPALVDKVLGDIIAHAPDAYILMGYSVGSDAYGIPGADPERDHFRHHSDKVAFSMLDTRDSTVDKSSMGKLEGFCSLASVPWLEQAKVASAALVRYIRSVPEYARRVFGYTPCAGSAGEWFGPLFFEGATDGSYANTMGFRRFLKTRYATDEALQTAWGREDVTLDTAEIPMDIPGAGIERYKLENELPVTLITTPEYQPYTDYEDYYSNMVAGCIVSLCEVIKKESNGQNLTGAFYGYHSEVRAPFSGSFGLHRLLKSPDVDILSGPVAYGDRELYGMGAYMSPVSSIQSAGKLWIDEGDYRTHCRTGAGFNPGGNQEGVGDACPTLKDENATLQVMRRQIGKGMVFGTGVWWLDLVYRGWFDYPAFWEESVKLSELFDTYAALRTPTSPDVAVVYDEEALNMVGKPWQYGNDVLTDSRYFLYRGGCSFGYFTTEDVIAGKTADTKLYLFLTPWRLDADRAARLKAAVAGKTACWFYGNGLTDAKVFEDLTGFALKVLPAAGEQELHFGAVTVPLRAMSPVYAAQNGKPLGTYSVSEGAAVAVSEDGRSVFVGGTSLTAELYNALVDMAGIRRRFPAGTVSFIDKNLVVLHTADKGDYCLSLPEKSSVYDHFADRYYEDTDAVTVTCEAGETRYFFINCGRP